MADPHDATAHVNSSLHDGLRQTFRGTGLKKTADQTISDATFTIVTFNTEDYDTNGFHDTGTNTGRITIPTGFPGYYLFWALVNFKVGATGRRIVDLMKNGTTRLGRGEAITSADADRYASGAFTVVASAVAGDYFECHAYAAGGSGATLDGANGIVWFGATLLGV